MLAPRESWALGLVFDAGRTVAHIARVTDAASAVIGRRFRRPAVTIVAAPPVETTLDPLARLTAAAKLLFDPDRPELQATRLRLGTSGIELRWRDVVGIARSSGLAGALRDMAQRADDHRNDPAIASLAESLAALDTLEQQQLLQRFVGRIESDPAFTHVGGRPRAEDIERVMLAVGLSLTTAMRELGLDDDEITRLAVLTEELARPLVSLGEVYASPRSWGQKLHRFWRLQLIGLRVFWVLLRSAPTIARRYDRAGLHRAGP